MTRTTNRVTRRAILGKSGLLLAAVLAVAGCEGLGDGNRPQSMTISGADDGPRELVQCLRVSLQAVGEFTNGARGDFTARASWRSSNPEVAQVSNGDIVFPGLDNAFLARGAVVPLSAGTATITAEFVGLSASVDVTVSELDALAVEPAESTTGVGSVRRLDMIGTLDGEERTLTQFATWTFETPDEDIATIGEFNGLLEGVSAGELSPVGTLDFCNLSATGTARVAPVDSVELRREFTDSSTLVTSTTEFMRPFALFANGDEQDLEGQVLFSSSNEDVARGGFFRGTPSLIVGFTPGGPVDITATFGAETPEGESEPDLSTGVTSDPLPLTVVEGTLTDLAVTPDTPTVTFGETVELTAIGTFDTTGDGTGDLTQDITRHVIWSADDNTLAGISNALIDAGTLTAFVNEANQVIATAAFTEGDAEFEAPVTVTIEPNADADADAETETETDEPGTDGATR